MAPTRAAPARAPPTPRRRATCSTPATPPSFRTIPAFTDPSKWELADLKTILPKDPGGLDYRGGAFDGKYLYFAPWGKSTAIRYDTTKPFVPGSFDTYAGKPMTDRFFTSCVHRDQYVYYTPYKGSFVRYDRTKAFADPAAWDTHDIAGMPAEYTFWGSVTEGAYVYFAPYAVDGQPTGHGLVVRYDSARAFGDPSAWSTFDLAANLNVRELAGAIAVSGKIYFVPHSADQKFARYDTLQPFNDKSSWMAFDSGKGSGGFVGGASDGARLHAAPFYGKTALRYEFAKPFDQTGSWSGVPFSHVGTGAAGASAHGTAFDGKRVYFAPLSLEGLTRPIVRYDTTAPSPKVETFDLTVKHPDARTYGSVAFDGRYVYFAPATNHDSGGGLQAHGLVARFDSRATAIAGYLPPGGSFF